MRRRQSAKPWRVGDRIRKSSNEYAFEANVVYVDNEPEMKQISRTAFIKFILLTVCGIPMDGVNAQSLTSVPSPSAEVVGLTKALAAFPLANCNLARLPR